jgi:hypothetical protein
MAEIQDVYIFVANVIEDDNIKNFYCKTITNAEFKIKENRLEVYNQILDYFKKNFSAGFVDKKNNEVKFKYNILKYILVYNHKPPYYCCKYNYAGAKLVYKVNPITFQEQLVS